MKILFTILFVICIIYTESLSQNSATDSTITKRDSITVLQQIGKTSATVVLTTLKVSGQFVGGLVGGAIGGSMLRFHPVTTGVGYILGSSYCVYLIGNLDGDRGQYKWVLTAGAVSGVLYLPVFLNNQHDGFGAIGIVGLAMVTSLTAEIITFYATEKDSESKINLGLIMLPSQRSNSYTPALNFSLYF